MAARTRTRRIGRGGQRGRWRRSGLVLAAALLASPMALAGQAAPEEEPDSPWFPGRQYVRGPLADPREPGFGVGLIWTDLFDPDRVPRERPPFTFGEDDGMEVDVHGVARMGGTLPLWEASPWPDGGVVVGVQAGVVARFRMEEPSRDEVGTDWTVAIPVEVAQEQIGWRLRLLHHSAHLGDELIFATGAQRIEFAHEAVDFLLRYRIGSIGRVYGGGMYVFRSITEAEMARRGIWREDRAVLQAGAELETYPWAEGRVGVVAALDWQTAERTGWMRALSFIGGVSARGDNGHALRLVLLRFDGASPMGEFFLTEESYWGIELIAEF